MEGTTLGDEVVIEDSNNKGKNIQQTKQALVRVYELRVSYPARLKKDMEDAQFKKFLDVYK